MYWKISNTTKVLLLLLSSGTGSLTAQTDSLFVSVDDLFRLGTEHSLQIQADRMKEAVADEKHRTARMKRLPDVELGLNAGYVGQPILFERGLSHPTYPDAPDWSQNYALQVSQPIYQGGKIRKGIQQAEIQKRIAMLQTRKDEADMKLTLLQQYLSLFSYYKQQEVLSRNIEESERRLEDIRRLKKEGLITNNDVLRSELQLTNDRLALKETKNTILILSQQLDILLGLDENLLLVPDTNLLHRPTPTYSYSEYVETSYEEDPTMQLLQQQTRLARQAVDLAKSDFRPSVSIHAGNTLARPVSRTLADLYNNNWNIGLSVAYPLSAFYKNKPKVNEARLQVRLSENAEEQQKQRSRVAIRQAFLRHEEATERVESLKLSVRQARENYRIVRNRYLGQLAILTDLLDANTVLLDAELQLTTARTQVIYTYYELQRACGKI